MRRTRVIVKHDRSKEFTERLKALQEQRVSVGVLGDRAAAKHDGTKATVGEIGHIHEFGRTIVREDGTQIVIPTRSFIRAPVELMKPELEKLIHGGIKRVLDGKLGAREMLEGVGTLVSARLKAAMGQGLPVPPLKPATIRRKGSSVPLIDKGQLRGSIVHVVRERAREK